MSLRMVVMFSRTACEFCRSCGFVSAPQPALTSSTIAWTALRADHRIHKHSGGWIGFAEHQRLKAAKERYPHEL